MFIDLLNEGGVDVNKEYLEEGGNTLLHFAVQRDSIEFARELLRLASCDPDTTNRISRVAPLHLAVTRGNPDMVRLLLRSGASLNIKNSGKLTLITYWRGLSRNRSVLLRIKVNPTKKLDQSEMRARRESV